MKDTKPNESLRQRSLLEAKESGSGPGGSANPDNSGGPMHPAQVYERDHPPEERKPQTDDDRQAAVDNLERLREVVGLPPLADEIRERILKP